MHIESKLTLNSINNDEIKTEKAYLVPSYKVNNEEQEEMIKETEFFEEVINKSDNSKNLKIGKYDEKNKYIIEKFYNPFLENMKFKLQVNENNNEIKKSIRNSARINYSLQKKTKEVEKISKECIIFNNPSKIILLSILNRN